jgi:hypothetical protein
MTVAQIHARLVENSGSAAQFLDSSPVHVASQNKPSVTLRPFVKQSQELRVIKQIDSKARGKVLVSVLLQGRSMRHIRPLG